MGNVSTSSGNASTSNLVTAVLEGAVPLVIDLIAKWQTRTGETRLPTVEELRTTYNDNRQMYIAEGLAWAAAHPEAPKPAVPADAPADVP